MEKLQVLEKYYVNNKLLAKDRKELAEIIKECKLNNIHYNVTRSLEENYRYEVGTHIMQKNSKDIFIVSVRECENWGPFANGEDDMYVGIGEIAELYNGNDMNKAFKIASEWKDEYVKLFEDYYKCKEGTEDFIRELKRTFFLVFVDEYLTTENGEDIYADELAEIEEYSAYSLYAEKHLLKPMQIEEKLVVESVEDFFKDSKIRRDGKLIPMYHGTVDDFDEFRDGDAFIWAAANKDYAATYSMSKNKIKEVYVNITNPFVVGKTNEPFEDIRRWLSPNIDKVMPSQHVINIAERLGIPVERLIEIAETIDPGVERHRRRLYQVVNKPEFRKIIEEAGYDGIICKEPYLTVGAIRPNQLKYVTNENPTLSNKLNEEVEDDEIFLSELPLDAFYRVTSNGVLVRTPDNETIDDAPKMENIVLPRNVRILHSSVFELNKHLKTFSVEEGSELSRVGSRAFAHCENLTNVTLPETLFRIESSAFSGCENLKNVDIKSTGYALAIGTFESCTGLEYIDVSGDTIIPRFCFSGCSSLKKVKVSDKLTMIDNYAFEGCHSLEGIILPETIESIGINAFSGCENMKYIVIPEGLDDISYVAFTGCDSLSLYFCSAEKDEVLYHILKDSFKCYWKGEWKYVDGIPTPIKSIKEDIEDDEVELIPLPARVFPNIASKYVKMMEEAGIKDIQVHNPIYEGRNDAIWYDDSQTLISGIYKDRYTVSINIYFPYDYVFTATVDGNDVEISSVYDLEQLGIYDDDDYYEFCNELSNEVEFYNYPECYMSVVDNRAGSDNFNESEDVHETIDDCIRWELNYLDETIKWYEEDLDEDDSDEDDSDNSSNDDSEEEVEESINEEVNSDEVELIPLQGTKISSGEDEIKAMLEKAGLTDIEFIQPIYKQRHNVIWFDGGNVIKAKYLDKYFVYFKAYTEDIWGKINGEEVTNADDLESMSIWTDDEFYQSDADVEYSGEFYMIVSQSEDEDRFSIFNCEEGDQDIKLFIRDYLDEYLEEIVKYDEKTSERVNEGIEYEHNDYIMFEPDTLVSEVKDKIVPIPEVLYHGTSEANAERIKETGGLTVGNTSNWSASRKDAVYLTSSIDDAYEYCHRAGIEDVTILSVKASDLDESKLYVDSNEEYYISEDDSTEDISVYDVFNYEYRDGIALDKINFIERNRNSLTEALSHNILFHRTSPRIATHILKDDELKVGGNYLFNLNRGQCICFSRDYNFIKNMNKQNNVVFVFNKDKLQTKYKLEPVSDSKNTGNHRARYEGGSKAEEVCFENITNMSSYLYKIVISDEIFDDYLKYLEDNNININRDICVKSSSYRVNESLSEDYGRSKWKPLSEGLASLDSYSPSKVGKAYKVFKVKNGKLYPPMVANPEGADTPIGVWLAASEGEFAGLSKTGRPQVKSTGSGTLAYRPGWHLGELPIATQFYRTNKETGEKEFPKDFVWAECDYVMDIDYQSESDEQGHMRVGKDGKEYRSDKYQHSLAGLKKLPKDGFYKYRTNPNPDTVPWIITGAMKVNKILNDNEVEEILSAAGVSAPNREGGRMDSISQLGIAESCCKIKESLDLSKPIKVYSRGNDKWTTTSLELYDLIEDSGATTDTTHDIETRELKLEGLEVYYPFEELDLDLFNQLYDIIGNIEELEEAGIPFEYVEEEPADWALVDFLDLCQHGTDLGYDVTIIPVDDEYIIYINDETAFDRKLVNLFEDTTNQDDVRRMEETLETLIYTAWTELLYFVNPDLIDDDGEVIEEDAGHWGLKNDTDTLWDYRFDDAEGLINVLDFEVDYLIEDWYEELAVYELLDAVKDVEPADAYNWESFYEAFSKPEIYNTEELKVFFENHRLVIDVLDILFNHPRDINLFNLEHNTVEGEDKDANLRNIFDEEDGGSQDE